MILKIGSTGEIVKKWQEFLISLGWKLTADGRFGKFTDFNTKLFQAKYGLVVDGIVGNNTFAKAIELRFELPENNGLRSCVIDISHYQTVNDFEAIKNDGIEGIIHKATEGTGYRDDHFKRVASNWNGLFGAYHFLRPHNIKTQAKHFFDTVSSICDMEKIMLALDFEDSKIPISEVEFFIQEIYNLTGRYIWLYTGKWLIKDKVKPDSILLNCKLWFAKYSKDRPEIIYPFNDFTLWQYTDRGRIAGISGNVDMSYLHEGIKNLSDVWI